MAAGPVAAVSLISVGVTPMLCPKVNLFVCHFVPSDWWSFTGEFGCGPFRWDQQRDGIGRAKFRCQNKLNRHCNIIDCLQSECSAMMVKSFEKPMWFFNDDALLLVMCGHLCGHSVKLSFLIHCAHPSLCFDAILECIVHFLFVLRHDHLGLFVAFT